MHIMVTYIIQPVSYGFIALETRIGYKVGQGFVSGNAYGAVGGGTLYPPS